MVRKYLSDLDFCEVETPYNPKRARDFVVPSRMNEGILCITAIATNLQTIIDGGGMDKYFKS
jgi:aspartyl-tRNA synthetase